MANNTSGAEHDLIELLDLFNRKERYFLICNALDFTNFSLGDGFREILGFKIGIEIPRKAGVWMDYHLDWLAAVIAHYHKRCQKRVYCNPGQDNKEKLVQGNQEDIDFLIAFKKGKFDHLVFIEAKGYTGWDNTQMMSKADRLRTIFGQNGKKHPCVKLHLCLTSPRPPEKLDTEKWPGWMKTYRWMELKAPCHRLTVARSEASGKPSKEGKYFSIKG